jgi:hypothetical protein
VEKTHLPALNEAQETVLRWIAEGCPEGVFEGYTHRISAAALRSRGLVTISGRGPTWTAEITSKGTAALEHAEPTASGEAEHARVTSDTAQSQRGETEIAKSNANGSKIETAPMKPRRISPTEQLIADLLAAGGVMRVPYWRREGEPDWRARVFAAQRFGKVPPGKRLDTRLDRGEMEIRLLDALPGTEVEVPEVAVPARLTRPHRIAATFRDDTDRHEVSRKTLARCVRIIHVIVTEAEKRGHAVSNIQDPLPDRRAGRSSSSSSEHISITVREHRYRLRIFEEKVPMRGPWEEQARWRAEYPYGHLGIQRRIGRYDSDATGRLTLALDGGSGREGRVGSWGDRKSWKLEEKVGELLREIEIRAVEDDERAEEARRKSEELQQQWEAAMERAKARFVESYRGKVLRAHVSAWQEAKELSIYLASLEEAHGDEPEAAESIEWVRGFITRLDPLNRAQTMPEPAEIGADDLKPFLGGLSPYGPRGW